MRQVRFLNDVGKPARFCRLRILIRRSENGAVFPSQYQRPRYTPNTAGKFIAGSFSRKVKFTLEVDSLCQRRSSGNDRSMIFSNAIRTFCQHRSIELSHSDISVATIANVFGVPPSTVSRWRRVGMQDQKLAKKSAGGRPRKLSDVQLNELAALLSKGAVEYGWPNDLWTTKRIAEVIQTHFNLSCHPKTAWRTVTEYLGWTAQRPIQQLRAADEHETRRWLEEDFPRIVERATRRRAHLVFVDESAFMLNPTIRKTYAPRGHPPICKVTNPHGKISVIGAMTINPHQWHFGFLFDMLNDNANYRGDTVVPFLEKDATARSADQ